MRFKQALSRKLAAALSAVMILSTIAPTSVPVLAAAPDDVLVDSNVEYDLQDAGSEDVLLDSAESSLAEETDTLEVAGEELLSNEAASDEVLVDSAEEVLSEETGIEPVETNDGIEVVEGATTVSDGTLRVSVTSENIIKKITFKYVSVDSIETFTQEIEAGKTVYDFPYVSANVEASKTELADGYAALYVDKTEGLTVKAMDSSADGYYSKFRLSVNGIAASNDSDTYSDSVVVSVNLVPGDTATEATVVAKRTAYDGTLTLNALSANILEAVGVVFDANTTEFDKTVVVSNNNTTAEIPFKNATKATLYASNVLNTSIIPNTAYTLSANTKVLNGTDSVFDLTGDITINAKAELKDEFNKTGNLVIKVASQNTVGSDGKDLGNVVSINEITVQLSANAIKWDGSEFVKDQSDKVIEITSNNNITIPYMYAEGAKISVTAQDGNNGTNTKYLYTIGDKEFKVGGSPVAVGFEEGYDKTKEVEIKPIQKLFPVTANVTVISNNLIKGSFNLYATGGTPASQPVAVKNGAQPIEFTEASELTIYDSSIKALKKSEARDFIIKVTVGNGTPEILEDLEGDEKTIKVVNGTVDDIVIEAIPYSWVTLSANDGAEGYRTAVEKYAAASAVSYTVEGMTTTPVTFTGSKPYVVLKVRPDKVLSVNNLMNNVKYNYLFPVIKDGETEIAEKYNVWTLGAMDQDKQYTLDVKEFGLDGKNSVIDLKSPQEGEVSVNEILGGYLDDSTSFKPLSGNKVFNNDNYSNNLEFSINTDRAEKQPGIVYTIKEITLNGYTEKKWTNDTTIASSKRLPITGSKLDTIEVPFEVAKKILMKEGKLEFTVTQYTTAKKYTVTLKGNDMKNVTILKKDNKVDLYNGDVTSVGESTDIAYGTETLMYATPNPGFKIVSVNIIHADSTLSGNDRLNEKPDDFINANKGYAYKVEGDVTFTFVTEKDNFASVTYATGSKEEVPTDKNGKYLANHLRKIDIKYYNGTDEKDIKYDVLLGKKSILVDVSKNAVTKNGKGLVFDGNNKDYSLAGKVVTVKIWTGDGSSSDTSIKELVFSVDAAATGITFTPAEDKMTLGTTKEFKAKVIGTLDAVAVVSGDSIEGGGATWNASQKSLKVETKRNTAKKKYTINIVDKNDLSIIYGTKVVELTTNEVEDAKVTAKVTKTTNHKVSISLASKVDTKIDGLFYKVDVTVTGMKKTVGGKYYYQNVTTFIPVTDKSATIDILNTELTAADKKVAIQDSDEDAKISIKVGLFQTSAADSASVADKTTAKVVESKSDNVVKIDDIKTAKGGIFATGSIKLKKLTKGNAYTNMVTNGPGAYEIGVDYGKATVCELDTGRTTLVDKDGNDYATWTIDDSDSSVIKFNPAWLPDGTYTLTAYALEPDGIDVKGSVKIKVVKAIENLEIAGAPQYIYKFNGKAANAALTAYDVTDWSGEGLSKVAKKVEWSIVQKGDSSKAWDVAGQTEVIPSFVTSKDVTIGAKNGKIKIKKDFNVSALAGKETKFYVKATAIDYAGNKAHQYSGEITLKPSVESQLKVMFGTTADNGTTYSWDDVKNNGSYYVADMFQRSSKKVTDEKKFEKFEYVTYVTVYDQADNPGAPRKAVPADIKVSGAGKLIDTFTGPNLGDAQATTIAAIGLNKPGKVKLTVNSTDGSGRKLSGKEAVQFDVKYVDTSDSWIDLRLSNTTRTVNDKSISFNSYNPEGTTLTLSVYGYRDKEGVTPRSLINHKISKVKGGKVVLAKNMLDRYTITPNDHETTFEVTKLINNKPAGTYTVKIVNEAIANKSSKVKTTVNAATNGNPKNKGTIYNHLDFTRKVNGVGTEHTEFAGYTSCNKVEYTVTGGDYAVVKVLPYDNKNNYPIAIQNSMAAVTGVDQIDAHTFAFKLENSKFTVDYFDSVGKTFDIKKGSYKITVTAAKKIAAGQYSATAKSVTHTIVAKQAPKATYKLVNNVTFSGTSSNTAKIAMNKPSNVLNNKYIFEDDGTHKSGTLNVNTKGAVKGMMNHFHTYFTLDKDGNLTFVGYTDADPKKSVKEIDPKANKEEFFGYVIYYYQGLDGTINKATTMVNLKTVKNAKIVAK